MPRTKHLDEARRDATECLRELVETDATIKRAVLITDLFGKMRIYNLPSPRMYWFAAMRQASMVVAAMWPASKD